jgi:hypothetical protein
MDKLLPCPFCGSTRLIVCETTNSWNDPPKAYAVSCCTDQCHGHIWGLGHDLFKTEKEARKAWNTRAKPTGGKDVNSG